jgi:hypothetical protein
MTDRDFVGTCDNCHHEGVMVHKFNMPKHLPEAFYQMFPEERNQEHPDYFLLCFSCLRGIENETQKI